MEGAEEMFEQMGRFNEELINAGIMLAGDGLKPSKFGKRIHFKCPGGSCRLCCGWVSRDPILRTGGSGRAGAAGGSTRRDWVHHSMVRCNCRGADLVEPVGDSAVFPQNPSLEAGAAGFHPGPGSRSPFGNLR
jgi:hypothetical protein